MLKETGQCIVQTDTATYEFSDMSTCYTARSYLSFNRYYFLQFTGVLKLLEIGLGAVCVALAGRNFDFHHKYLDESKQMTFLIICSTFMIGTYLIMLSSLISSSFSNMIGHTIYELVYNLHAGALHLLVSSIVMSETQNYSGKKQYNVTMSCAIVSLINAVFYFISAFIGPSYKKKVVILSE